MSNEPLPLQPNHSESTGGHRFDSELLITFNLESTLKRWQPVTDRPIFNLYSTNNYQYHDFPLLSGMFIPVGEAGSLKLLTTIFYNTPPKLTTKR